jgi:hypothetical protein
MMDKKPMQADGSGSKKSGRAEETASRPGGTGESGGGAYPNPHTGKPRKKDGPADVLGHGGQSEIAYHGGPNPNAATQED